MRSLLAPAIRNFGTFTHNLLALRTVLHSECYVGHIVKLIIALIIKLIGIVCTIN